MLHATPPSSAAAAAPAAPTAPSATAALTATMRARRRLATTVVAVAVAAVSLSGCATSATAGPASSSASASTVDTLYGTVDVPANPKRIVAIGFPEATALADLGITPVGRTSYIPELPFYTKTFADVPAVTDSDGNPDLEKIAALHPDLIIGSSFVDKTDRAAYAKLTSIAPTVILEWKQAAGNWPAEAAGTAKAVGRTAQLDTLKAAYAAHTKRIRTDYADALAANTVDLISGDADNWYLYGEDSSHGQVLVDAGARLGAANGQKDGFVQYSPEQYGLLKSTNLVIVSGDDATAIAPVTSNSLFASSSAATSGHVTASSHFFSSSYRSADALLDDFEQALKHVSGK